MKSHANSLLVVACGILKDVHMAYPEYSGVVRDKARLTRLVEDRGLGVFTLDLPARQEKLLQALQTGRLDSKGSICYSKNYPVPRLFAGLYMRIFDRNLCLKSDLDINAVTFLNQLLAIGKKTEVPCSHQRLLDAVKGYHDVERELHRPSLRWDCDVLDPDGVGYGLHLSNLMVSDLPLFPGSKPGGSSRSQDLLERCQHVADIIIDGLGQFEPYLYSEKRIESARSPGVKHGPGAVAERKGRFFDKNSFPNWPAKLQTWFPYEEFGKMPNLVRGQPRNHEVAARLIAVPKTAKGPRLIASEPSEHQWCQQLMLSWFNDRFDSLFQGNFITLKNQQPSREMTLSASLTGALATVDLSSASDRLSCYVVERMFRRSPTLIHSLHACRTRYVYDGISKIPSYTKLKKFASQGTAVTFPVQSLVFLICALASSMSGKPSWSKIARLRHKVRVFGDDIIVPTHGYDGLVELLTLLQLKVNTAKSFHSGNFRESCGMDALLGCDITPIKPKTTIPDSPAARKAVLDTYNNLFCKGYWNASDSLRTTDDRDFLKRITVVGRDAGATGRKSFSLGRTVIDDLAERLDYRNLRYLSKEQLGGIAMRSPELFGKSGVRVNHRLQRVEVRTYSIRSKSNLGLRDCGYSALLQFCVAEPPNGADSAPRVSGVAERPRTRDGMRWEALPALC